MTLPVYYAAEAGADLEAPAQRAGLSTAEVISLHSGSGVPRLRYWLRPGLCLPRPGGRADRRAATGYPAAEGAARSGAIADRQTAVYPAVSPVAGT